MTEVSCKAPLGRFITFEGIDGAGKSTLFKMIEGREAPDAGEIKIGPTVRLAAVDQMRDALPNDKTVFEAVSDGLDVLQVGKFSMQSRAYLGRFNFKGCDQLKLVGSLSGGERGRLHLAKTLLAGGNVLLLDEPSNDLDVETLRALATKRHPFMVPETVSITRSIAVPPSKLRAMNRPWSKVYMGRWICRKWLWAVFAALREAFPQQGLGVGPDLQTRPSAAGRTYRDARRPSYAF